MEEGPALRRLVGTMVAQARFWGLSAKRIAVCMAEAWMSALVLEVALVGGIVMLVAPELA